MKGLSSKDAKERIEEFGYNSLPRPEANSVFRIFFNQFLNPLIYALIVATIVSVFLNEISDAIFIFAVIIINAVIGTIQEYSAQKEAESLRDMVPHYATVIRDNDKKRIDAKYVVPDDFVLLESGDKVPADIKLTHTNNLAVDESLLTGESMIVEKYTLEQKSGEDKQDIVFAGTIISRGRGQGTVIATGIKTELGKIAESITEKTEIKLPLMQRLERFTFIVLVVMMAIITLLFIIAIIRGGDITEVFLISIALAVAAIPEGLPAAITVALSVSMKRMANNNVIIRKLLAVESLGSCTFIASDKTGTLTINEMTIKRIVLPNGIYFDVSGEGLSTKGEIDIEYHNKQAQNDLGLICKAGVFANEANLHNDDASGDMVDIAFLVLGKKYGLDRNELLKTNTEIAYIPYESEKGFSANINEYNGTNRIFVKGSLEKILSMCTHSYGGLSLNKNEIEVQMEKLANQGYRVIALAEGEANNNKHEDNLKNLNFLGLVGMIDPLRPEAKEAIRQCKNAGIEVAMITGDHPATANAIANELGINDSNSKIITGNELQEIAKNGYDAIDNVVENTRVFARIEPRQKQEIVESLIRLGHYVAVTGDGVNDAPALKHAHVGIAMGKRGTDVARENAHIILTDDNFSSIVKGIEEGRIVYNNIRKVILLLIATGAAEIILFVLSILAGLPMPLLAVQLLWLNLVTNGIQHIAIGFEPAEGNELNNPPRKPNEPIFNRLMIERILVSAVTMAITAFILFKTLLSNGYDVESARNMTLLLMVIFENIHALQSRSEKKSIFKIPFFSNILLPISILIAQFIHIAAMYTTVFGDILQIKPVSFSEWYILLFISIILLVVEEIHKFIINVNSG